MFFNDWQRICLRDGNVVSLAFVAADLDDYRKCWKGLHMATAAMKTRKVSRTAKGAEIRGVGSKVKFAKNKISPARRPEEGDWRKEVRAFLDEAETEIEGLGAKVDSAKRAITGGTEQKLTALEDRWEGVQDWLSQQVDRLKKVEAKAERTIDTAEVRVHLAGLEAKDSIRGLEVRLDGFRESIAGLRVRANTKTAETLEKLSRLCLTLKGRLEN